MESGVMGIHQAFFRARDPVVFLMTDSYGSIQSSGTAISGFVLTSFNDAQERTQAVYTTVYAWLTGGTAADYEAMWTNVSGTLSIGTAGAWLNLGTTREWNVQRAALGVKACQGTLVIRRVSDGVTMATATIDLSAEIS